MIRFVLACAVAAVIFPGLAFGATNPAAHRPNVLFIAVDDLRVELGCYGDTVVKSPHIDRLADAGLLFERAYCQQALCNPSRASVMTGLRPDTLGVTNLRTHFRDTHPDLVTLPQLFMAHGYHARNIGKIFHNAGHPEHQGDASSWSVPAVLHYATHNSDTPVVEGAVPPDLSRTPRTECRDVPDTAYFDGRVAAQTVEALRELRDTPFFLAVGFWKPHLPFNAPKKYWDLYEREDIALPANPGAPKDVPEIALHESLELMRDFDGSLTEEQVLELRHGYYAAISYVDAQIGKVLDELDALGLREKTIVVFWSDHGFHLGEHSLWCKASNFELDARVPLIVSAPGLKAVGQRSNALVELLDLYPTLAELCGLPIPAALEGTSLRPVLEDTEAVVKQAAFTQHPRPAYSPGRDNPEAMGYSVRTDRFRYTEWRGIPNGETRAVELYDHAADPQETINLAPDPEHAGTMAALGDTLARQFLRVANTR